MSTFYGQVFGQAATSAARRGSAVSGLTVSCQSYDGSIIVSAIESGVFSIKVSDTSSSYGETIFTGTVEQLRAVLEGGAIFSKECNTWEVA